MDSSCDFFPHKFPITKRYGKLRGCGWVGHPTALPQFIERAIGAEDCYKQILRCWLSSLTADNSQICESLYYCGIDTIGSPQPYNVDVFPFLTTYSILSHTCSPSFYDKKGPLLFAITSFGRTIGQFRPYDGRVEYSGGGPLYTTGELHFTLQNLV